MDEKELGELRARFPQWYSRRPKNGPYVIATRQDRTHLTDDELVAGMSMTLMADTAEALGEALAQQDVIEAGR